MAYPWGFPLLAATTIFCLWIPAQSSAEPPPVTAPPESFFLKVSPPYREKARQFYAKYLDIGGIPVAASEEVADAALWRTHEIVTHMLAGRPDIVAAMTNKEMYLIIIGRDQLYTEMPEYSDARNPDYLNERVRGTGGRPTSFGEENLLSLPIDRYDDESIAVHEFCHTIDGALRESDANWNSQLQAAFQNAQDKGLYHNTYAMSNRAEYWAEIGQAYFDCNRVNNWNHGPIGTREQLKIYDPMGYELCRATFRLAADQDWRYRWLQPLPNVIAPPDRFGVDAYYTRFTWAREFPVVGRQASDASLLAANHVIRRMFAYRHDILKALIATPLKLVVLGPDESLADLPEVRAAGLSAVELDLLSRTLAYRPELNLLVVGEEMLSGPHGGPHGTDHAVIRLFADAVHRIVGTRAVDPDFDQRGQEVQQYELRVERLDERFDQRLTALFDAARTAGKWRGTSAGHDPTEYWITGVLAYFEAPSQNPPPHDTDFPITSREQLKDYDVGLYELVHETMAHGGRLSWRLGAP